MTCALCLLARENSQRPQTGLGSMFCHHGKAHCRLEYSRVAVISFTQVSSSANDANSWYSRPCLAQISHWSGLLLQLAASCLQRYLKLIACWTHDCRCCRGRAWRSCGRTLTRVESITSKIYSLQICFLYLNLRNWTGYAAPQGADKSAPSPVL